MAVATPRIVDSSRANRRATSASGNAMARPSRTDSAVIWRCSIVACWISGRKSSTYWRQIHSLVSRL